MKEEFLVISDLKKSFGSGEARQEVLRGMDFTVKRGEFCVLLGPSGSGKSTLLNIIGGIDTPDSGFVSINGDKLEDMDEKQLTIYRLNAQPINTLPSIIGVGSTTGKFAIVYSST